MFMSSLLHFLAHCKVYYGHYFKAVQNDSPRKGVVDTRPPISLVTRIV